MTEYILIGFGFGVLFGVLLGYYIYGVRRSSNVPKI